VIPPDVAHRPGEPVVRQKRNRSHTFNMELVEPLNGDPSLLDIEGIEGVTGNDECR
jgi:hypothetical protein